MRRTARSADGWTAGHGTGMPVARPALPARVREVAMRHERARDLDRRRLARELHDELGQLLNAARMEIGQLHRLQQRGPLPPDALDRLDELVAHAAAFTRRLSRRLRPPALDFGLVPALEALCDDVRAGSGLRCDLTAPEELALDDFVAHSVYRLAEQALANVVRHAKATTAVVRLTRGARGLELTVGDDGTGFDPDAPPQAPGLEGTVERVALIGGRVEWSRGAGGGTLLTLRVPPEALAVAEGTG